MATVTMDPRIRARRAQVHRLRGRRRLRVLVVFCAATAFAIGGWWLVLKSPVFDVDQVNVVGARMTDADSVVNASGINKGQSLVEVDMSTARTNIAQLPWVESVSSERSLGGEVTFDITERSPAGVVAVTGGWAVVDAVGRVLDTVDTVPADVVVVEGGLGPLSPGDWVPESRLDAIEVAAQLPSGLQPKVATVTGEGSELRLVLFGGGVVDIGDTSDLEAKFLSTLTLLVRLDISCLERIDVRAPAVPILTRAESCS